MYNGSNPDKDLFYISKEKCLGIFYSFEGTQRMYWKYLRKSGYVLAIETSIECPRTK